MAMPWSVAKARAAAIRADETGAELERLNRLFNACFRIQREAIEAAGRHIPMVVENVRGAQPWVGRAKWNFGSFYLWGDVPALMPPMVSKPSKMRANNVSHVVRDGDGGENEKRPDAFGWHKDGWQDKIRKSASVEGLKQPGIGGPRANGKGDAWFQDGAARHGSKSSARKMASAMIAKIPEPLSRHIAATYYPR